MSLKPLSPIGPVQCKVQLVMIRSNLNSLAHEFALVVATWAATCCIWLARVGHPQCVIILFVTSISVKTPKKTYAKIWL